MNPFAASEPLDPRKPSLASMEGDVGSKMRTYSDLIIERLLVDWIGEGEKGSQHVYKFSALALKTFAGVDVVDLNVEFGTEFGEQLTIFRACVGLMEHTLEAEFQERYVL